MTENGKTKDNGQVENGMDVDNDSLDTEDEADGMIPTPPDGGWGWVIVAASLFCNIIVDGIGYSFGIFLPEFVKVFGESRSKVSLIGSLLCGTYLCAGPIVSAMVNKFGCRPVAMTGSVISTVAFVLATFSPNIEVLILVYGVLGGFGFGMIYLPSIVSVGYYFERKRAVATGIAVCGSGVGTFIFAPLTKYLLDEFDWKNSLFILAGIVFNGAVCGALMRPLEPAIKKVKDPNKVRDKTVLDRLKESAKINRKGRNITSESSGIGTTDTTDILEKVKQAKLLREKVLQENESDQFSLPSARFEKDKSIMRQDSRTSGPKSRLQKLSFSEIGDSVSNKTVTPVVTPRINVEGHDLGSGSLQDNYSESGWSNASSPMRAITPDDRSSSPTKKRLSNTSTGSHGKDKTDKNHLSNGIHYHEVSEEPKQRNAAQELMARSGAAGAGGSRHLLGASTRSMRSITNKDYARPMYKKSIFYTGSTQNITEFRSQPNMSSYIQSITSIPGDMGAMDERADTKLHILCSCLPKPVVDVLSEMLDISLLTNVGFMCICLGNIFAMIGFYVPYVYIVDRALIAGIDKTNASFLLSVIGITNTVGRLLSGVFADMKCINSLMLNNVCMLVASAAIFLTPFCGSYETLIVAACVFGFSTAAYISLTSIIICDLLGLEKLTNAFGLLTLARGISSTLGPPLAGAVFQSTGNYDASFYMGGGLFLTGTLLHFVLFLPCFKHKDEPEVTVSYTAQEMEPMNPKGEREKPERVVL